MGTGEVVAEPPQIPVNGDMKLGVVFLWKATSARCVRAFDMISFHTPDWDAHNGVIV